MLDGDFAPNFPLKHQQKEWGGRLEDVPKNRSLEVNIRKDDISVKMERSFKFKDANLS